MRTAWKALALPCLLALAGCGEDAVGPETAQLSLQIVSSPDAGVVVDSATVHLQGPISRTLSADDGETVIIAPLEPGTYEVGVEGWDSGQIAWFSELTVRLDAGEQAERLVLVGRTFAPTEVEATEEAGMVSIQWDAVPGAVEYLVLRSPGGATSDGFEEEGRTASTSLQVGPFPVGQYAFQVQAMNRFDNSGPPVEVAVTVVPARYTLLVSHTGPGSGSVTSSPAGIDCGSVCAEMFDEGTIVTLTAEAETGSSFDGWEGAGCSGTGTCVVTVDQEQTVAASFSLDPVSFPVTVQVEEGGELPVGSVVSEPAGIRCGDGDTQCSAEFREGQEVVLTHRWPEEFRGQYSGGGTGFGGWAGDCEGFERCALTVDGSKEVVATAAAELSTFFLVPRIEGGEGWGIPGLVAWPLRWNELEHDCMAEILFDDGANSPNHCSARIAPGTHLSFTSPVRPVRWEGGCDIIEGDTCRVVVRSGFQAIDAFWYWRPPEEHSILEIDYYGGRDGAVRSDVPGIYPDMDVRGMAPYPLECGVVDPGGFSSPRLQCSQVYPNGTRVTLTAFPQPGYEFTGWTGGGCSGVEPCVVVMDRSGRVRPSFTPASAGSR